MSSKIMSFVFSELAQSMFSLWCLQDGADRQQLCQPQEEAILLCVSTKLLTLIQNQYSGTILVWKNSKWVKIK